MTSSNPELDAALKVLKDAGHVVGSAAVSGTGEILVPINGVPKTYEQIFEMVDEERRKPSRNFVHPDRASHPSGPDDESD